MPKKGRKKGGRKGGFVGSSLPEMKSVIVPFRQMYFYGGGTSASSTQNLAIPGSAMGDRVSEIGDSFLHWRLRKLRVESLLTAVGTVGQQEAGSPLAIQYTGSGAIHAIALAMVDTSKVSATPTLLQASQLPCFTMGNGVQKLRFTVPESVLTRDGTVPWYETQATGSESAAFQIPGFFVRFMVLDHDIGGNIAQYVIIEGEVEFRDPCDSTITMLSKPTKLIPSEVSACDEDEDFKDYLEWKKWQGSRKGSIAAVAPP